MMRESKEVSAVSFGIGAVPNCFFPLINVEPSDTEMDTAGLHRSKDPGTGAFTPYYDHAGLAVRDIKEGEELFINYGTDYFKSRGALYQEPIRISEEYETHCVQNKTKAETDIFGLLHGYSFQRVKSNLSTRPSSLRRALPDPPRITKEEAEGGASEMVRVYSIRDLDWLEENGSCMDNIREGISTIDQAGRGAFAARPIKEGDLVAPVPLIHIANRTDMTMFKGFYNENGKFVRNSSAPSHYQLLLNYCFGHRYSSVLLCPYGIGTELINHSKDGANARIVWSYKSSRHLEWLEKPLADWVSTKTPGLAFDYIATREIKEGEEIFIDYGYEWEVSWNMHVAAWTPPPGEETYSPSCKLYKNPVIRTVDEGLYPAKHVELVCRRDYSVKFQETSHS